MKCKESLQRAMRQSCSCLKKNSSTILTSMGAIGVVGTAVVAVKSTPRALELLATATDEKGDELTILEKVYTAGPVYIPSIMLGISTIACIFGANSLNKRTQASLMSAYGLLSNSYNDYRNKVKDIYGEEGDNKIRDSMAKDKLKKSTFNYSPGDELLFFDEFSGRFFRRTMEEVRDAEYQLNRRFTIQGEVVLNEFYDLLGLPRIDCGSSVGWSQYAGSVFYGYSWIDFNHILVTAEDGDDPDYQEFYRLIMPFEPTNDYDLF